LSGVVAVIVITIAAVGIAVHQPDAVAAGTPPTEPGAITFSAVTSTSVTLSWGSSQDPVSICGYRVYRQLAGGPQELIATTDDITDYTATSLRSNATYTFGVTAIDIADNESAMSTANVTTLTSTDTSVPAAPSAASLSVRAFSSTRLDVLWGSSSSTNAAYYEVYRNGTMIGTVDIPQAPHYSDNGLSPSTTYTYSVDTVSSNGVRSPLTGPKTGTTLATGAVIIPRGPVVSNVTGTNAVISWWTNIPTNGVLTIGGQTLPDSAGDVQHHAVSVSGLTAATTTPYTVSGTDPNTGQSATASGSVTTMALPGSTFSFAAMGDYGGGGPGEIENAANIGTAGTQFIQTLGDNIYPSAGLPDPDFTTTYSDFDDHWYKELGPDVNTQAFFPANGNKDYYSNGQFWVNFPMLGTNHEWYSYNWGDAHILVLDSEQPLGPGSAQYAFAQADLAANQSEKWRIVVVQNPPYSSTDANSSSKQTGLMVPLFQGYRVNLLLSGNSHNYERSYPLTNGVPAVNGITYIVSGGGGSGFDKFTSGYPEPSWSAYRESNFWEFAKITVSPSSIQENAVRADTDTVFDSTTIGPLPADTTAPAAPTGVDDSGATMTSVPLTWTPNSVSDGVTGYNVYRDGKQIGSTSGTTTTFTDTNVVPGTTYQYTVDAFDGAGNVSPLSAPFSVIIPTSAQPALVQSTGASESGTANSLTATFSTPTTPGDLLVVSASDDVGSTNHITSVTDSAGDTWTKLLDTYTQGHNSDGALWYSANAHSATSVTVHTSSSAEAIAISAQEFSGVATSNPVDATASQSATGTSATSGGATPTGVGDLAVGFIAGHSDAEAITVNTPGFVTQPQQISGVAASVITGESVLGTTAAPTFTGTFAKAMYWTAGLALFKPTATAPPPTNDFSITATPSSGTVTLGSSTTSTTSTITTAVTTGSAQSINLTASGEPSGTTVSFNPSTVTAGGTSTMTVATSSTTPTGTGSITVTGTGTSTTHTASYSLTVNPVVTNGFSMSASPSSGTVTAGSSTTSTISTLVTSGVAQTVGLSASGAPTGALVSFSPNTLTAGTGTSTMTITTASTTPGGTYPITITGTGTAVTHTASFFLTVDSLSSGTPALVQYAAATETATATSLSGSFPTPTTSGDLLVLTASEYNGATNHITSVTDSAGNTWTRVGSYDTAGDNSNGEIWYSAGARSTSTVTATNKAAASMSFVVQEFSGVAAAGALDTSTGASGDSKAAASGTATSSVADDLAVGFVAGHLSAQAITVTAPGYTAQPQQTSTAPITKEVAATTVEAGYQVLGAPGATAFSGSFPATMYWAAGVALFKPAA
jgi:fibronectin type 3 domain-containing protein